MINTEKHVAWPCAYILHLITNEFLYVNIVQVLCWVAAMAWI